LEQDVVIALSIEERDKESQGNDDETLRLLEEFRKEDKEAWDMRNKKLVENPDSPDNSKKEDDRENILPKRRLTSRVESQEEYSSNYPLFDDK